MLATTTIHVTRHAVERLRERAGLDASKRTAERMLRESARPTKRQRRLIRRKWRSHGAFWIHPSGCVFVVEQEGRGRKAKLVIVTAFDFHDLDPWGWMT